MSKINLGTIKSSKTNIIIIYSIFILIFIINIFPILWIFITAVKPKNEVFMYPPVLIPSEFKIGNFITAFSSSGIAMAFFNSIVIAGGSIFLTIFISSYAAYGFSRFKFKFKNILLVILIGSQMIPAVTNIIPLYIVVNKIGLYDTKSILILLYSAAAIPFCTWIIKSYMDTIPRSIDESSLIDGATHRKTFFYILFPLLKPVIAATVVFVFVYCWNEFYLDFVLTATANARTIPVALFSFQSSYDIDWNLLCAASILALLPIVIIFLSLQKQFIAGLTHGAIKG